MTSLYLDACTIIYLLETGSAFHATVKRRLLGGDLARPEQLVTSHLARLECRTRPLRDGNRALIARYDEFFNARHLSLVEVSAAVIERATALRAKYGFKTPDALHLATALEEEVDGFLTGDTGLARCNELRVEILEPALAA